MNLFARRALDETANVIPSVVDKQPNMAVDTHVFRVSARIGLTRNAKTPLATEKQLTKHIPAALIHKAHHWLIYCMAGISVPPAIPNAKYVVYSKPASISGKTRHLVRKFRQIDDQAKLLAHSCLIFIFLLAPQVR